MSENLEALGYGTNKEILGPLNMTTVAKNKKRKEKIGKQRNKYANVRVLYANDMVGFASCVSRMRAECLKNVFSSFCGKRCFDEQTK